MKKLHIVISIIITLTLSIGYLSHAQTFGGGTGTIDQLEQWRSTTTPSSAIIPTVTNKAVRIPNLSSSGSPCVSVSTDGTLATTTCDSGLNTNPFTATYFVATSTIATSTFSGNVFIGTTTPSRGIFDVNNSTIYTIGNAIYQGPPTIVYSPGKFRVAGGETIQLKVYAFKNVPNIPGGRLYSASPITLTTTVNSSGNTYYILANWGTTTQADGYKIVHTIDSYCTDSNIITPASLNNALIGFTTSACYESVSNTTEADTTVTPSSPYKIGANFYIDSDNGAITQYGDISQLGNTAQTGDFDNNGTISTNRLKPYDPTGLLSITTDYENGITVDANTEDITYTIPSSYGGRHIFKTLGVDRLTIANTGGVTASGSLTAGSLSNLGSYTDSLSSIGSSGMVLQSTGSATKWVATSTLGLLTNPAGSNTQVQFNNSGAFGATSTLVWNNTTGTFGIGTSTPSTALEVKGNAYIAGTITATSSITGTSLNIINPGGFATEVFNGGSGGVFQNITGQFLIDQQDTVNDIVFRTNATARLNIKSTTGNIGISTSTPSNKLEVLGNGYFAGNLSATGTINIDMSTSSTKGVIRQAGNNLLHTYGTNNLFLGSGSGNFTLDTTIARSNVGIGFNTLSSLASPTLSGNRAAFNVAVGSNALSSCTTCSANFGLGDSTFTSNGFGGVTTQDANVGIGSTAGYGTTASQSVFIGNLAGRALTSPYTATNSGCIGYSCNFGGVGGLSNAWSIGSNTYWTRSNQFQLGNSSIVETILRGNVSISTSTPILPTARLDIVGNLGATTDLLGISSTTNSAGATSRLVTVTKAGSVGIGSTTPAQKLVIEGNEHIAGDLVVANITATGTIIARIVPRYASTTSSGTPTINTDNTDMYELTAQAANITSMTTNLSGTPRAGQRLTIAITGTGTFDITWGTGWESSAITLPTTGAITTSRFDMTFVWNPVTNKWRIVGIV